MDFIILYAKVLGIFFTVTGLGMLINAQAFRNLIQELSNNIPLIILTGMASLLFGLILLFTQHAWTGWPMIITLIAYFLVAKGILRICFTRQWVQFKNAILQGSMYYVCAIIELVLGLLLLFFGVANL